MCKTAFTGGLLIDGTGAAAVKNSLVLVDDGKIVYAGPARGIPEDEARKLVVRGFFAELINKIPVEELRERLGDAIEARLVEAGQ